MVELLAYRHHSGALKTCIPTAACLPCHSTSRYLHTHYFLPGSRRCIAYSTAGARSSSMTKRPKGLRRKSPAVSHQCPNSAHSSVDHNSPSRSTSGPDRWFRTWHSETVLIAEFGPFRIFREGHELGHCGIDGHDAGVCEKILVSMHALERRRLPSISVRTMDVDYVASLRAELETDVKVHRASRRIYLRDGMYQVSVTPGLQLQNESCAS